MSLTPYRWIEIIIYKQKNYSKKKLIDQLKLNYTKQKIYNLSLAGPNNDVVDGDENKLHKEAHKSHYNKSDSCAHCHLWKLYITN